MIEERKKLANEISRLNQMQHIAPETTKRDSPEKGCDSLIHDKWKIRGGEAEELFPPNLY